MDKALLEELYQRYGAEIFRYLYAMCRDRLLAEDVMQDAFCRALISLPTSHVNARAWLYMVGRNLLINEMKKRNILIRDCADYRGLAKGWYRIAVRRRSENQILVRAFEEIMKEAGR